MSNPNFKDQLKNWHDDLLSFFSKKEINQHTDTLLEVYINSYHADDQEQRQKMFLFIQKLKELS